MCGNNNGICSCFNSGNWIWILILLLIVCNCGGNVCGNTCANNNTCGCC